MVAAPRFHGFAWLCLLAVLAAAGAARTWYLFECAGRGWDEPALQVQEDWPKVAMPEQEEARFREPPTKLQLLAANIAEDNRFSGIAPFSSRQQLTAYTAPGYPWLLGTLTRFRGDEAAWSMRWLQCVLGSLTAVCYFLFARLAFHNTLLALLAGLLAAFHPFWIINTAEINDGVLATFLVSLALMLGTRSGQNGGGFSGLLFGAALAALCMVRAACLPFALVAALWFLWRCRRFATGWLAGVLMLVGFVNGLAPWVVRNYSLFDRPVPIVTTTYYHLWLGNNAHATGSTIDPHVAASPELAKELADEKNEAKRDDMLAKEAWSEIKSRPSAALGRRILATIHFLLGDWLTTRHFAQRRSGPEVADLPEGLEPRVELILNATLIGLFALALIGWRISYRWRIQGRLGAIAAIFLPLPYILGHAEAWSGPRLPFDGVLLCFAAYTLVSVIPGVVRGPGREPPPPEPASAK